MKVSTDYCFFVFLPNDFLKVVGGGGDIILVELALNTVIVQVVAS